MPGFVSKGGKPSHAESFPPLQIWCYFKFIDPEITIFMTSDVPS